MADIYTQAWVDEQFNTDAPKIRAAIEAQESGRGGNFGGISAIIADRLAQHYQDLQTYAAQQQFQVQEKIREENVATAEKVREEQATVAERERQESVAENLRQRQRSEALMDATDQEEKNRQDYGLKLAGDQKTAAFNARLGVTYGMTQREIQQGLTDWMRQHGWKATLDESGNLSFVSAATGQPISGDVSDSLYAQFYQTLQKGNNPFKNGTGLPGFQQTSASGGQGQNQSSGPDQKQSTGALTATGPDGNQYTWDNTGFTWRNSKTGDIATADINAKLISANLDSISNIDKGQQSNASGGQGSSDQKPPDLIDNTTAGGKQFTDIAGNRISYGNPPSTYSGTDAQYAQLSDADQQATWNQYVKKTQIPARFINSIPAANRGNAKQYWDALATNVQNTYWDEQVGTGSNPGTSGGASQGGTTVTQKEPPSSSDNNTNAKNDILNGLDDIASGGQKGKITTTTGGSSDSQSQSQPPTSQPGGPGTTDPYQIGDTGTATAAPSFASASPLPAPFSGPAPAPAPAVSPANASLVMASNPFAKPTGLPGFKKPGQDQSQAPAPAYA